MLPPCSRHLDEVGVGLPGADGPPQRLLYALKPNSNSIFVLESVLVYVACQIRCGVRGVNARSPAPASRVPPASIQPSGVARQPVPVVPIHWAPLQPCCSSQKRFSLFFWLICQVRRSPLAIVELSLRACSGLLWA